MCSLKHRVSMPQSNKLKCCTDCNHICRQRTERSINSPTSWIVYITNFQYFQIIHTSNQCGYQCYSNRNLLPGVQTPPNNTSFPQESIYRRQSSLRNHKNPPCKGSCCRTLILTFQIHNILRSCSFERWLVWTSHWNKDQPPNS